MAALLITTIEGMLIGLGFGLGLDRLFNWSNPNFLFVAMFMVAGAILGMLGGYFFVGSVHEQPWMVLVGQAAAAVVAVMLVAALFVLAGLPYDDRILVLAGVWGSFPGAGIGLLMGLGGSRRSPELSPRSQPTLAAPRLATPVFGANAVLGDGAAVRRLPPVPPPPHVAAASEPLRFAPPEPPRGAAMSGVLLRLDREVTALRAQNIEARLLALDGAQSGVACAVVRLRSALGDVYTLYLTCDAAYPTTAPSLTVSRSDAQSGIEQEVAFTSQVVSQWRVGGSAGEVVMEFARRVGIR